MTPSLALDPALLAIAAITKNEAQVAAAIGAIASIAQELRAGCECRIHILADSCTLLADAGLFPAPMAISKMLADFGLSHVYTAEDIRRAVNDVLSRTRHLETLSEIDFMIPTSFIAAPEIRGTREGPLREGLELTLLHVAFAARVCHPKLVQILIADMLISREIKITADLENIDPALKPDGTTNLVGFESLVWTAASVEQFLQDLVPEIVWQNAEDASEFSLAIKIGAHQTRRLAGCPSPKSNCETFTVGPHFVESLGRCEATGNGRHASSTLAACARIVARMPKEQINALVRKTGAGKKKEQVTRPDNALAWRTHLSKRHEAMRLMFWKKADGTIEFSSIGPKSDLEIL
jgi:hypothetical protein